jgi:hypothetical protein
MNINARWYISVMQVGLLNSNTVLRERRAFRGNVSGASHNHGGMVKGNSGAYGKKKEDPSMSEHFMGKFSGGDINLGTTVQACHNKVSYNTKPESPLSIRACMFFDGTLNNRTNVALGKLGKGSGGSYDNELSNIAILEKYYLTDKNVDISFFLYVEGIGTTNFKSDSNIGSALGTLGTGIIAKVESGIAQIITYILKNNTNRKPIKEIFLDAFGFSRGAAAARNFVYATLQGKGETLKSKLASHGYKVGGVKVKFVGLYDTVAAYGVEHDNNTKQLHLDSLGSAEKVVQLAAAEEHRLNFRLINIKSAVNGLQIFLPGAHSDVGGGYLHNSKEESLHILDFDATKWLNSAQKSAFVRERKWLLESGWYLNDEVHDITYGNELKVTRRGISNRYSRIPLMLMARLASENGVHFNLIKIAKDYPVPNELQEIEFEIIESSPTTPDYWLSKNSPLMKKLRHNYLHFSACYGSVVGENKPQFTGDDPVNGQRRRVIQNG